METMKRARNSESHTGRGIEIERLTQQVAFLADENKKTRAALEEAIRDNAETVEQMQADVQDLRRDYSGRVG